MRPAKDMLIPLSDSSFGGSEPVLAQPLIFIKIKSRDSGNEAIRPEEAVSSQVPKPNSSLIGVS